MSQPVQPQRDPEDNGPPTTLVHRRAAIRSVLEPPIQGALSRLMTSGDIDVSALREQLRLVCVEAKRQGLHAEQVLIAVKEIWASLSMPRDATRDSKGNPVWSRIVALTLDEYYESPNPNE